jgi:hypothetical protein
MKLGVNIMSLENTKFLIPYPQQHKNAGHADFYESGNILLNTGS